VTGLLGGARDKSQDIEAGRILDWEIITQAIKDGYKWFEDFGANTRHLCDSKSKYSPMPSLYFLIQKSDILGSCAEKIYKLMKNRIV